MELPAVAAPATRAASYSFSRYSACDCSSHASLVCKLASLGMPLSATFSVLVPQLLQMPLGDSPVEGTIWLE